MARNVFEFAKEQGIELNQNQTSYLYSLISGTRNFVLIPEYDREVAQSIYNEFILNQDVVIDNPTT